MVSDAPPNADPGRLWAGVTAVLVAGLFAWWGAWRGEFLFDDHPAFENEAMRAGDWWAAAFAPPHQPLACRPLTTLSLAADLRLFGFGPFGPHLGNLVLHLANACLVLLVARRALGAPNLAGRFAAVHANGLATAIALVWVVHPLATDAVAYATQRSTVLGSGLLLAGLYATARGVRPLAVAAAALAMASKEDFVVAPLLLASFDRAFLLPSWRAARARCGFHAALAATWAVLALCIALGPGNPTVGYATEPRLSAFEWLATQAPVVWHYLRLTVWPSPLRGAYDWDYVRTLAPAVVPGLAVLAVLALTQAQWLRRPWWAWLGLCCFLLLAPTSTVLPIRSEVVAERRMYLPMLLVVVAAVVGVDKVLARAVSARGRIALAALAALGLAFATRTHLPVYRDEPTFWADAFAKRTVGSTSHLAAQILGNHAAMLFQAGRFDEAHPLFDQAVRCEAPTDTQRLQHAVSLQVRGERDRAIALLEQFVAQQPDNAEAQAYLGISLVQAATAAGRPAADDLRVARAEAALRRAVALDPRRTDAWNSLGLLLALAERWQEAEAAYAQVTGQSTMRVEPFLARAELLRRLGRKGEIGPLFERLLADPRHAALVDEIRGRAAALMR